MANAKCHSEKYLKQRTVEIYGKIAFEKYDKIQLEYKYLQKKEFFLF
jgi:hypothetical protein